MKKGKIFLYLCLLLFLPAQIICAQANDEYSDPIDPYPDSSWEIEEEDPYDEDPYDDDEYPVAEDYTDDMNAEFEKNFFFGGLELIVPLQFGNRLGWGINAGVKFGRISVGLDVQIVDQHFYDYVGGDWVGPTTWENINATSRNWLFFHDVVVLNIEGAYHFPLDWFQPYVGGGVSFLFVVPNTDAMDAYPGFKKYFLATSNNIGNNFGAFLFGGVDFFPGIRHFSIGLEYIFRFDQLAYMPESFRLYGVSYLLSCSHLVVRAKGWF